VTDNGEHAMPPKLVARPIWDRPLVLVTGKGGVGKSTLAASLARSAWVSGRSVLLAEATSELAKQSRLFPHFGRSEVATESPEELAPNLFGIRLVPSTGHRLFLEASLRVKMLVNAAMRSASLTRFLMAAPAFPEIGTLYHLITLLRSRRFDHIIVDLPATGHALGLVSLPRSVVKIMPSGLIGTTIREGLEAMTNPKTAHAVLVTVPEGMPVTECFELARGMTGLGISVGAMVLNQVPRDSFDIAERAAVREYLDQEPRKVLGVREFRRLERSIEARDRFFAGVPAGVASVEVPLLSAGGEPLVRGVQQAIEVVS
jgi:arsenite/tail-anchored protein-transporting ATPase